MADPDIDITIDDLLGNFGDEVEVVAEDPPQEEQRTIVDILGGSTQKTETETEPEAAPEPEVQDDISGEQSPEVQAPVEEEASEPQEVHKESTESAELEDIEIPQEISESESPSVVNEKPVEVAVEDENPEPETTEDSDDILADDILDAALAVEPVESKSVEVVEDDQPQSDPEETKMPPIVMPGSYEEKSKDDSKKKIETVAGLADRLSMWNRSCRDLFVDLRSFDFECDDEEMYLESRDTSYFNKLLYFKRDPENPRDPRVLVAQKQFCRMLGVPHSFFFKNRPQLRMDIVKTWQSGLDADKKKGRCLARIRESQDFCMVRAFVPESYMLLQNHELIELVGQIDPSLVLESSQGDNRDDLILNARFLFQDKFQVCGTDMKFGFSLVVSEMDASPFMFDVFLYHVESKTAYAASYGSEPFFRAPYSGIQANEIKKLIGEMVGRAHTQARELKEQIETNQCNVVPHEECIRINTWSGLSNKFKKALFHEAYKCEDDMGTLWDFGRHMSLIAKDFETRKRLEIERAAGRYVGLNFSKE